MWLINFFRENNSEIIGVHFDEDKIFLARLTDTLETAEINFELDVDSNATAIEQLAKKISEVCQKRGWKTARMGLCLREGEAATFQTEFKNVPSDEIAEAVKIWAMAHVGNKARYTSIKFGDEIWMEALPESSVEEYISAWQKFSMKLCALTELPSAEIDSERAVTPFNRAVFAAEIIREKQTPNILTPQFSVWNFKKISKAVAAIFLAVIVGISAKVSHDYFSALAQLESAQEYLNSQSEILTLKENLDANIAEMKRLNNLSTVQNVNAEKFNLLLKIGKVTNENIHLQKIRMSGNFLEIEGSAETPDVIKNYLSRLKSSIMKNVKLENSQIEDAEINFSVRINL